MLPIFTSIIQQAPFTKIHISVYYTRASMMAMSSSKISGYLPPNITLTAGRPKIPVILGNAMDQTCSAMTTPSKFVVGACGPVSLHDQVRKAVGEVDGSRRDAVGGIELCEECVFPSFPFANFC
jgi:ferric-chelate reductase